MIHFKRISHRLLIAVGSVVVVGIVGLVMTYASNQEDVVIREVESSLAKTAASVAEGLSALMAVRHANVAPDFAKRLKNVPNVVDYRILRMDGTEAFVDNSTVEKVDERLGEFEFPGRKDSPQPRQVIAASAPELEKVRQTGEIAFTYRTLPGGERQVTTMSPIRSSPICQKCHEEGEKIRGVVMITTSLKEIDTDISQTWKRSAYIIVIALLSIVVLTYWFAHRMVVSRIIEFSQAMKAASKGDMTVRLPTQRQDELGHMAHSFNRMNKELLDIYADLEGERSKLNTIIQGATSGIIVTDADLRVVLVNRAAELILGKDERTIINRGILNVFDDEEWMTHRLNTSVEDSSAVLRDWYGKTLSVQASTLCNGVGEPIGSAVLIRDVSEEKRLERQLKEQSITDALTGLFNRRHFDATLQTEFMRWRRYKQPLSVMMLDIDHFKKFNDTHGHECGDHVLEAIGKVLGSIISPSVIPCRYGGEEMVIIMPGQIQGVAVNLAEDIRKKIAQLVIDGLNVTVSIGVAGCPGHEVDSGDALVKLADEALYAAKEGGRNQVRAAESEVD